MREAEELSGALRGIILGLLAKRGAGKTICPSEAARAAAGSEDRAAWEPLMNVVRDVAEAMVARGEIVVTQGGVVVDLRSAKGPVRLRLGEREN